MKETTIHLRAATISDLDLVRYWDTKQHVIDCDPEDQWDWEFELNRAPSWRKQFIAQLGSTPIGFLQVIDPFLEDTQYWAPIGPNKRAIDIWIGEEYHLNKGYGSKMMALAIQRCFKEPSVQSILVDPLKTNTRAHRFYERLGFRLIEEREFNGAACLVYELKRT